MKKLSLFVIMIFLISTLTSVQKVNAQDKNKDEQEIIIQKKIEEQKRSMTDQKRALEAQQEALESIQVADEDLDSMNLDIEVNADAADRAVRAHVKRINRSYNFDMPYVIGGPEPFFSTVFDGNDESTSWEFSRKVKEKSLKSEYTFDVEKTSTSVVMSVNGDCKAGEIRVKIIMPGGKTYSDIVIDEFGNLNWRKSFSVSETENQDKAGAWKFVITSNKATGYFKISLQAY